MTQMIKVGTAILTEDSQKPCTIEQFLGGGGQGEVYRVNLEGQPLALKWYFQHQATDDQRQLLQTLINRGSPDDRFLWPMSLVSSQDLPGFGYLMHLREQRFKGIVDLMKRRIEPPFLALVTACLQLADGFLQLHAKGLCYRDISFGNVFFDPKTGDIQICDNDNVSLNGETSRGVLGTPRFMAPEIVRDEAEPSTQTDLFSLAVLLFYMLMMHHPLEGRREADIHSLDWPAMNRLYGTDPLFIFDPDDASNRPVSGYQDNAIQFWPLYPQFLRDLFTKAFTDGIRDPMHGRVRESEWRLAMVKLRDAIVYCACDAENFYDAERLRDNRHPGLCWSCKQELHLPPRVRIDSQIIMLNFDAKLYPHHIDAQRRYDFGDAQAEMSRHPTNPNLWGLKNLSKQKWSVQYPDGTTKDVEPGRSIPLANGIRINFGGTVGEIRA